MWKTAAVSFAVVELDKAVMVAFGDGCPPFEPARSSVAALPAGRDTPGGGSRLDVQVRVHTLDEDEIIGHFEKRGFRVRPKTWNRVEVTGGRKWPKLVFAPPVGKRPSNVHVREVLRGEAWLRAWSECRAAANRWMGTKHPHGGGYWRRSEATSEGRGPRRCWRTAGPAGAR